MHVTISCLDDHPRKFIREKLQDDQTSKIFYLENFPIYGMFMSLRLLITTNVKQSQYKINGYKQVILISDFYIQHLPSIFPTLLHYACIVECGTVQKLRKCIVGTIFTTIMKLYSSTVLLLPVNFYIVP